jgi:hypothetical protein
MADMEFSRDDIASLIEKISTLQPDLSDQDRQLLMSIFALAAEHTGPAGGPEAAVTLPEPATPDQQAEGDGPATVDELRRQLLEAYTPGSSFPSATEEHELAESYSLYRHSSIHRHSIHR